MLFYISSFVLLSTILGPFYVFAAVSQRVLFSSLLGDSTTTDESSTFLFTLMFGEWSTIDIFSYCLSVASSRIRPKREASLYLGCVSTRFCSWAEFWYRFSYTPAPAVFFTSLFDLLPCADCTRSETAEPLRYLLPNTGLSELYYLILIVLLKH